jgi:hypothetical protein
MEQIHAENPDKGYCRINDNRDYDYNLNVNEKRVRRIFNSLDTIPSSTRITAYMTSYQSLAHCQELAQPSV